MPELPKVPYEQTIDQLRDRIGALERDRIGALEREVDRLRAELNRRDQRPTGFALRAGEGRSDNSYV